MERIIFVFLFLLLSCTKSANDYTKSTDDSSEGTASVSQATNELDQCRKNSESCASIDIEKPDAREAYQIGCEANNFYSCYRLGQYHEIKSSNIEEAIKAYSKSCDGKYAEGCEDETSLRSKLCFIDQKKEFCKGEPKDEYRILVFLQTLDPKYRDAFVDHNFSYPFTLEQVKTLYNKRIDEQNKMLLEALLVAQKQGHHDGADAEGLQTAIWKLEGNKKMLEDSDY